MKRKSHISLVIIMLSCALFCCYHIYYRFLENNNKELVKVYYEERKEDTSITKINNDQKEEYLGILRIPKINLKEGFYHINSKNNNISKSVTILKESTMPNENGSIIYLVAHSGSGYLAFFKDINVLTIGDTINLDIGNKDYQYVVNDIYELNKNGKIMVNHNIHDNYLVLSTCGNNNKQLIVTSKLIKNNV